MKGRLIYLRQVGIVAVVFLVEYVVVVMVGWNFVKVFTADTDDEVTGVDVLSIVLPDDVAYDDFIVVGVGPDVLVLADFVLAVATVVIGAHVSAVVHVNEQYLSNKLQIDDLVNFVCLLYNLFVLLPLLSK